MGGRSYLFRNQCGGSTRVPTDADLGITGGVQQLARFLVLKSWVEKRKCSQAGGSPGDGFQRGHCPPGAEVGRTD